MKKIPLKHLVTALGSLVIVLLLVACEPHTPIGGNTPHVQHIAFHLMTASAILAHAPVGSADVLWSHPDTHLKVTITIHISGLAPKSIHPFHIHVGTCQSYSSTILDMLPPLIADKFGQAKLQTSIILAHLPQAAWVLTVHNGPTMITQPERFTLACGQIAPIIMKANQSDPVREHVVLAGTMAPNEAAHGVAHLTLTSNGDLTVTILLHGLTPRSSHAVHVHAGSCDQQGAVLFPLAPLVANDTGDAGEAKTFHHVNVAAIPPHGWYINVHFSPVVTTQTGYNPIACGNVIGS